MLRVRDVMTCEVIAVEPWTPLRDAAALLAARHVSGVPVVENGRLVGVISSTDLLAAAGAAERDAATDDEAADDEPPGGWEDGNDPPAAYFVDAWERAADLASAVGDRTAAPAEPAWSRTVDEAMTRDVLTVSPSVSLEAAAAAMRRAAVHRLLVVEEGRLVGVVSAMDVVRAVAERRLGARTYVFGHAASLDPRGRGRPTAFADCADPRPSGEQRR